MTKDESQAKIRFEVLVERDSLEYRTWEMMKQLFGRARGTVALKAITHLFGACVLDGDEVITHQIRALRYFRSLLDFAEDSPPQDVSMPMPQASPDKSVLSEEEEF